MRASVSVPLIGECLGACDVGMHSYYSRLGGDATARGRKLLFAGLWAASSACVTLVQRLLLLSH